MVEMYGKPFVKGFTTNPTLMQKAGISDYPRLRERSARGDSGSPDLVRGVLG